MLPQPPATPQAADIKFTLVPPGARKEATVTSSDTAANARRDDQTVQRAQSQTSASNAAVTQATPVTNVTAEGPTSGPVGLIIPLATPSCDTGNENQAVMAVFVDYEQIGFYTGTGLGSNPIQITFWTMNTPYRELGEHQLSFACYDSGFPEGDGGYIILFTVYWDSAAIWKDDGFSFNNTDPSIPTEVSSQHAGPGYVLATPSGAPAGPRPCPTVDATPWRTARITFYSRSKSEWLYPENKYTLSDPLVAELDALPFQIPLSAKRGEYLDVTAVCNRPADVFGAFEAGFTFYSKHIALDVPAGGPLSIGELAAGGHNLSEKCVRCFLSGIMSFGWPVDASTGNFWHSFTDFSIPGRGLPLDLTRTYNSFNAGASGPFGYGWSFPYGMSLHFPDATTVEVRQENGSEVTFTEQEDGSYTAPPRVNASLSHNEDGTWRFVRQKREIFSFTSSGKVAQAADLNGNVTSLAYDSEGHLAAVTDPSGRNLTFTYIANRISTVTGPLGREVQYSYDGAGNLTDVTDAKGGNTHFTYDGNHRLLTMRLPNQEPDAPGSTEAVISNAYNDQGRVIAQTDQLGRTTTFSYSGQPLGEGGRTTITDPRGNVTVQEYRFGQLLWHTRGYETSQQATWSFDYDLNTLGMTRITDPNGHTTSNTFDADGNVLTTKDPLDRVTTYTYDALDNRTSETDPRGTTTSYAYDSAGNLLAKETPLEGTGEVAQTIYSYEGTPGDVTAATDPVGHTTHFNYDGAGNRTSVTDPVGNETTYAYNAAGELISRVSPAGNEAGGTAAVHTSSYTYNSGGELTSETDQLGHTTSYTYDGNGNRLTVTDANGHTTRYAYSASDELTEVTRPDGSVLKTEWDSAGNMTAQIDAAGHMTAYDYDPLDRLVSATDPNGHAIGYTYDSAGNKIESVSPEGQVTNYSYNQADELISVNYPGSTTPTVRQEYDGSGNRVRLEDGTGTSNFIYDSLNRLTSATDGLGETLNYEYDLAGNVTKLTYPNGQSVTRNYDAADNLTAVTDWLGHTSYFSYNADGDLTQELYPNGVTTQRSYDNADRLGLISADNASRSIASFAYTRDAAGQVTSEAIENGESAATSYNRSSLDQLTAANSTPYGYDAADNPTTFGAETTQQFDPANQLISSTGPWEAPESPTEPPEEETPGPTPTPSPGPGSSPTPGPGPGSSIPKQSQPVIEQPGAALPRLEAMASAKTRKRGRRLVSPRMRTPHAHSLVLVFVSAAGARQRVQRVRGGGLRWKPLARQHDAHGVSEIWKARARKRFHGRVMIRLRRNARLATAAVAAFGNSAYIAGHSLTRGRKSAPHGQVRLPHEGVAWGTGHSRGQARAPRARAGERIVSQFFNKRARVAGWVQKTMGSSANSSTLLNKTRARHWAQLSVVIASRAAHAASASRAVSTLSASSAQTSVGTSTSGAATTSPASTPSRSATFPEVATSSTEGLATRDFTYNQSGNRTAEELPGGSTRTLTYDQAYRLIGIDGNVSYTYNGDGLRFGKTVNGANTHFTWNQAEPVPELLKDGSTYYLYGPRGEPIEQITGSIVTYLHRDQQGSVRTLTGESGSVLGRYDYDPWGNVLKHTGPTTSKLQYNSQYTDTETGYQYLRARYYDPATGQFLTTDPLILVSNSRYGYADNDPITYGDASGEWIGADSLLGAAIGAVVGTVSSAGGYGASVLSGNEQFSWRQLGASTAGGLIGGTAAGACVGTTWVLVAACGAGGGAAGAATTQWLSGRKRAPGGVLGEALVGAVGGAVGRLLFPLRGFVPYKLINVFKPGPNARRLYKQNIVDGLFNLFGPLFDC